MLSVFRDYRRVCSHIFGKTLYFEHKKKEARKVFLQFWTFSWQINASANQCSYLFFLLIVCHQYSLQIFVSSYSQRITLRSVQTCNITRNVTLSCTSVNGNSVTSVHNSVTSAYNIILFQAMSVFCHRIKGMFGMTVTYVDRQANIYGLIHAYTEKISYIQGGVF